MSTVNVRLENGIAELELNRPEARNAINLQMVREMNAALDALLQRDELRAVIVCGSAGKAFASGADIAELRERTHREAFLAINASLFQRLDDFPRPTIAAIEGFALGGGLELALACDMRVASWMGKKPSRSAFLSGFATRGKRSLRREHWPARLHPTLRSRFKWPRWRSTQARAAATRRPSSGSDKRSSSTLRRSGNG